MCECQPPLLYVIAGPNGAGKTTFAREFLPAADVLEFLNPDLLAAGLSPLRPATMAVRSARLLLGRWRELLSQRREFAFESNLSGRTYAGRLSQARAAGYQVRLCYLWLPNVAMSLRRVRERVRKGGMTFRKPTCGGGSTPACATSSRSIFRWRMRRFCSTPLDIRPNSSPIGGAAYSRSSPLSCMNTSKAMPEAARAAKIPE